MCANERIFAAWHMVDSALLKLLLAAVIEGGGSSLDPDDFLHTLMGQSREFGDPVMREAFEKRIEVYLEIVDLAHSPKGLMESRDAVASS